ncbi:accessory gene regulator B family protein [Acutalibacter muris]|jgi:accessory gene regulator protein AgrB|uniref:accessory gene regulator B family protein n=1 Tax=Acutalibacter muris TaxID=1796620 RepID=UPI003FA41483
MLNACATELTDRLLRRFPMAQARKAVYIYGFELTLSSLAVMLSVFILSCLFGAVNTSFTFSLIFVSIRLFSGGYHAKTYGRCFILSNAIYMGCFGAAHLIQLLKVGFLGPFLTLLSMTVICVLAPIKHKNHPMSDTSYQKNRNISLTLTICEGLCLLMACFFFFMPYIVYMGSTTMAAVAVLMVIPKIQERRKDV